jgi:hypothetical protein
VVLFKHSLEYVREVPQDDCDAQEAYLDAIESAGFTVNHERVNAYEFISDQARTASTTYGVKSISLLATKTKV